MSLPPGTRLAGYEVIELVGAGGMGEVYRARDPRLGRDVAIKVLPGTLAAGESASRDDRRERFEREARAAATLSHPNIVAVHEFGMHGGLPFVVMELLAGATLRERLAEGPLPVRKAVAIAIGIARGLAAAHERHLIHRDLKPENVFLLSDGQVKILDFGLARAAAPAVPDTAETMAHTDPGTILGTVGYMAPEQVRGEPVDARADLFALGLVLYEMLTGRRAFQRATAAETMTAILREEVAEIPSARSEVPAALERIVEHALEKNPDERFQTARDVIFALASLSGTSASSPGIAAPPHTPAPTGARRQRLPALAAAGMVLLASGGLAGWWQGSRAGAEPGRWERLTKLTDAAGEEDTPHISPDGSSFVYAAGGWGRQDIYVQRVGGRNPVLVVGDSARPEVWPAFSPEGTQIAFNIGDGQGGVFLIGATGESERRLTDFGGNPAWSPDGKTIAFATETVWTPDMRLTTNSALWTVSASGGEPRRLYAGDAVQPAWSPSGRRVAFWMIAAGQRDLATVSADGTGMVKVTDDAAVDWCPVWSPDGRYLYFGSDRGGSMGLWRIPIDEASGRVAGPAEIVLAGTEAWVDLPTFSADGRALLFRSRLASVNPAAIPLDPVTLAVGSARMLLDRVGVLLPSSVSPDGNWIAMFNAGTGEGAPDLFVMRSDGSSLRRLTDDVARDIQPQWSPDQTRLVFSSNRNGQYAAWSIRPDGSGLSLVGERTGASVTDVSIAPADGTAVFSSSDGKAYLAKPPFPVPEERQEAMPNVSMAEGTFVPALWSPDSRTLAGPVIASSGAAVGVAVYDLATRQPTLLTTDPWIFSFAFLPDSRRLLYFTLGTTELVVVDITSRARRVIPTTLPFRVAGFSTAIAPDGRTLYVGAMRTETNVWKVEQNGRP